jgi:hypothetical protein
VSEAEVDATIEAAAAEATEAAEGAAPAEGAATEGATTPPESAETPPAEGATAPDATAAAEAATAAAPTEPPAEAPAGFPAEAAAGTTPQLDENGQPIPGAGAEDLTKGGWVIQMVGHHFHNSIPPDVQVGDEATQFVLNTFCKNLKEGTVQLPDGEGGELKDVKFADLGIKYPVVVYRKKIQRVDYPAESEEEYQQRVVAAQGTETNRAPTVGVVELPRKMLTLHRFDFILQFMWQPTPRSVRAEKEKQPAVPAADGVDTAAVDEATPAGT